jgi:hypothetical protein
MIGAFLDRLHGQIDAAISGEDDEAGMGVDRLQLRKQLDGVSVVQPIVEDGGVGTAGPKGVLRRLAGLGLLDLIAFGLEEAPQSEADGALVVDEKDLVLGQAALCAFGLWAAERRQSIYSRPTSLNASRPACASTAI